MFWLSQIQQRKFKHQKVKAGSWMMLNVSNTFKRRMLIPLHSLEGMIYASVMLIPVTSTILMMKCNEPCQGRSPCPFVYFDNTSLWS